MARPPRVPVMLPWECKVIYFLTLCIVPRCNALANDAVWRALCKTLKRLDKWNTYCVLVMPDHVHLLTAPLERELSVAVFLKWRKRWFNETHELPGNANGNREDSIVCFEHRNRFTKSGITFARIPCARVWSRIGRSGHIATDFPMTKFEIWNCRSASDTDALQKRSPSFRGLVIAP
jgi:hypothetical protein